MPTLRTVGLTAVTFKRVIYHIFWLKLESEAGVVVVCIGAAYVELSVAYTAASSAVLTHGVEKARVAVAQ